MENANNSEDADELANMPVKAVVKAMAVEAGSEFPLSTSASGLPSGRFSGPKEFAEMIRAAFDAAANEGWREIVISDPTFEDWPLGEKAVFDALNDWSKTGRKFTMLAKNYDEIIRRHARFVTWRRTWSHIIECRGNSALAAESFPSAFWTPTWVFQRLDIDHCTGIAGPEAARRVRLKEFLAEPLARSAPAFPATTLGI